MLKSGLKVPDIFTSGFVLVSTILFGNYFDCLKILFKNK